MCLCSDFHTDIPENPEAEVFGLSREEAKERISQDGEKYKKKKEKTRNNDTLRNSLTR